MKLITCILHILYGEIKDFRFMIRKWKAIYFIAVISFFDCTVLMLLINL